MASSKLESYRQRFVDPDESELRLKNLFCAQNMICRHCREVDDSSPEGTNLRLIGV
jgi:hypothetical protein